jgi:hypothetical protein
MTAADSAKGYTAGPITLLDASAENAAGVKIDVIDARIDWRKPAFGGAIRLYGAGTYYLRNVQTTPFQPDLDRVGYYGDPMKLRGNAGADWMFGPATVGLNVRYFGHYRIYPPGKPAFEVMQATSLQGSIWVPAQAYVDLHASWRHRLDFAGRSEDMRIDFGVVDLFDTAPPRESIYSLSQFTGPAAYPGYSRYGDPRQRRFLLTVSLAL